MLCEDCGIGGPQAKSEICGRLLHSCMSYLASVSHACSLSGLQESSARAFRLRLCVSSIVLHQVGREFRIDAGWHERFKRISESGHLCAKGAAHG